MAILESIADLDVKGRILATTVPNSTGSIVTWNSTTNIFGLRTNAQIIADLGLQGGLTNGLHTTLNGNKVDVAFDVNTYVKDKSNNDRLLFGNTQPTDVVIQGAVANGDFKIKDSTGADTFRIIGSSKVPQFPQLPAQQTIDGNIAIFDTGNSLWKHATKISDLALASQIPTDYWTTNTSQTGLTGNKTTSGIITSSGGFVGALTGNASTATTLATARTINGTSFNGSANIVTALWGTARNITIGNATKSVNGSGNVVWSLAEIGVDSLIANFWSKDRIQSLVSGTVTDLNTALPNGGFITGYGTFTWGGADRPIGASYGGFIRFQGQTNGNNSLDFYYNNGHGTLTDNRLWFRTVNSTGVTNWLEMASREWADSRFALAGSLDNYLPLLSNKTGSASNIQVDLDTETNSIGWATSSILNRPNNTNASVLSIRGAVGYGGQIGMRNQNIWFRGLENNVWNNWAMMIHSDNLDSQATSLGFIKSSSLSGYLPLAGGTMTGNVNFFPDGNGIQFNSRTTLRGTANVTVLAGGQTGANPSIFFRPQGDANSTAEVTILANGQINTANHGNSSQWKQAFDWGNHNGWYVPITGNGVNLSTAGVGDFNNITTAVRYTIGTDANPPTSTGSTGILWSAGISGYRSQISMDFLGRMSIRSMNNSVFGSWREVITDANLDTQATSLGFIKSSSLPTVNNGALTLTTGTGLTGSATFTANQAGGSTFTVGIASTHVLPTTAQVATWNAKGNGTVTSVAMTAPTGLTVTGSPITTSGTLALTYASGYQGYTTTEATKLAGLNNYVLPNASATVLGGIKVGANLSIDANGVLSATNTNTTYTAGTGLSLTGTTFGQTITTSGTGTFVTGITQTTNGFQVNLGTPPNNTYTAGTGISIASNVITNSAPNATHTGDVTGATALTIANGVVTNAKMANMAANTFKGRLSTAGAPQDLTVSQMQSALGLTPPNNGNITYTGTGSITGGGTSTANQSGNTNYTFDLTTATKNDITAGKDASTQLTSLFADAVEYFKYNDVSAGGSVDTNEAFFNLVNPTTVSNLTIDIGEHHVNGARLVLQGVAGMGGIITYIGNFIMRNHGVLNMLTVENEIDQEFVWDVNENRWREVF